MNHMGSLARDVAVSAGDDVALLFVEGREFLWTVLPSGVLIGLPVDGRWIKGLTISTPAQDASLGTDFERLQAAAVRAGLIKEMTPVEETPPSSPLFPSESQPPTETTPVSPLPTTASDDSTKPSPLPLDLVQPLVDSEPIAAAPV